MDGKIVGICMTQPGREGLACRAVYNWLQQTYRDRELLVYGPAKPIAAIRDACAYAAVRRNAGVTYVGVDNGHLIDYYSAAMSFAVAMKSAMVCFWDDDDQYHRDRLVRQAASVQPGKPSLMSAAMWHYLDTNELFISDIEKRHVPLDRRVLWGTMLAATSDLASNTRLRPGGNLGHQIARDVFKRTGSNPARSTGEWWWTKFGVRGDNAQGYEAHRALTSSAERTPSAAWLLERRVFIEARLREYLWEGEIVSVCGADGEAFEAELTAKMFVDNTPMNLPPIGEPTGLNRQQEKVPE